MSTPLLRSPVARQEAGRGSFAQAFPEVLADDPALLLDAIRRGLPTGRFDALQAALDLPTRELLALLHLSPSTLSRRRQRGTFEPTESERLLRLGQLVWRAIDVLEGIDEAQAWLKEPARALGGEVPLHYAAFEPGAREVERLLTRIEHGVFS